ncbi:MAG: glycogen synthase [Treponema sp.]|nr:glycogen synthase [Treponema sp.]
MKILMISSEAVPFAKAGGLADMVSSLSLALAKQGNEVKIVIPRYYCVDRTKLQALEGPMGVPVGNYGNAREEWCKVYSAIMPGSGKKNPVEIYFIDHEKFFGRDGIYGTPAEPDFLDNPQRFSFFCKSIFQLCRKISWYPDVLHSHDWPTALVPVYLKFGERRENFSKTISIFTVHNLGYQGVYYKDNFDYTGLGWENFYIAGFDDWNMMNFLKAALWSSDSLNTVSGRYAEETKTQVYGSRLDGVLRYRTADYRGILNGIDTNIWNPKKDKMIPVTYSWDKLAGKAKAKEVLQKEMGLPVDPDIPVLGLISRLTEQKGVAELFGPGYGSAFSICRDMNLQMVVLGNGASWCENEIQSLSSRLPNFRAHIGYSERMSHLIEAGSDFYLMPSRYEPCGLNQMYSLNYGTVPIVRNTGGLTDTVENYNQETGGGTGFMFDDATPQAIYNTVGWAVWAWYNRRNHIEAMRIRGMKKDFSWASSAKQYVEMYEWTLKKWS